MNRIGVHMRDATLFVGTETTAMFESHDFLRVREHVHSYVCMYVFRL